MFVDKRELQLLDWPNNQPAANQNQAGADNPQMPAQFGIDDDGGDDVDDIDADPHEISTSDFIILQSSFECKLLTYSLHTHACLFDILYTYSCDPSKNLAWLLLHKITIAFIQQTNKNTPVPKKPNNC